MHHFKGGRLSWVLILAFVSINFLSSCEKEVHINLQSVPPSLVVEGYIENGQPPYVLLTNTISFFSNIDLGTLENNFVHGANITISDGTKTITLKEYTIDTGSGNRFYIYSVDTGNFMLGETEKYYTLTINVGGKTYTSTAKIPNCKGPDSLWDADPQFVSSKTPANAKQLYINYTDPDTLGNHVHYYTRRNSEPYYSVGVFDDQLVNGTVLKDIGLGIGHLDVQGANNDSLNYAYPGDTFTVKWCAIDKGVFDFWNSYYYAARATGNPFATPINVKSNISNGAIGAWSAYGTSFKTIVVH